MKAVAAFLHHVVVVGADRAEEEMIGSDAVGNITAMQHAEPLGNRAMREQPRGPVGGDDLVRADADHAVALIVLGAGPEPTGLSTLDKACEADREGSGFRSARHETYFRRKR